MKLDADLLVSRAARDGGGLAGLLEAISHSRRATRNRLTFLSYLVLSFGLRAGWLLPALMPVETLHTAVSLLFVGLIMDLFAGIVIAADDRVGSVLTGTQITFQTRRSILRRYLVLAGVGGVTGILLSALPFLFPLIGLEGSGAAYTAFRGSALILSSLTFLFRLRRRETGVTFDRPMLIYGGILLALLIAGMLLPAVGAMIGIPVSAGASVLLLPLAVLLPLILPLGKKQ